MKQLTLLVIAIAAMIGTSNAQSCADNGGACPPGLTCYTPASGTGAYCINTQRNPQHCGEMDDNCSARGESCFEGECGNWGCPYCNTPEQECCDFTVALSPIQPPRKQQLAFRSRHNDVTASLVIFKKGEKANVLGR